MGKGVMAAAHLYLGNEMTRDDQQHSPVALTPEKDTIRTVLDFGWGGLWPVWTTRKISPSQRFDPRNVHALANHYTNQRDKGDSFNFIQ